MYGIQPMMASATKRKKERREIRNVLGTSRDDAPSVLGCTRAAIHLNRLIYLASGRRFEIVIKDNKLGQTVEPFQAHQSADKEWQADYERARRVREPLRSAGIPVNADS